MGDNSKNCTLEDIEEKVPKRPLFLYVVEKWVDGYYKYNAYRGYDRKRAYQVLKDRRNFFKENKDVKIYLSEIFERLV
jgi:hypothetical protein